VAAAVHARRLIMTAYLANFSAQLGSQPVPEPPIKSYLDFIRTGSPVCIRNSGLLMTFINSTYPGLSYRVVGQNTIDVLRRVADGTCFGGLDNELYLRYSLGADAAGEFCGLRYSGEPSETTVPVALMMSPNTTQLPDDVWRGFNYLLDAFISTTGNYTLKAGEV
jgi:hypothetical protein